MKTLHLNLKKEWFDKIKSGEKTIEYREVKDYWTKRLMVFKNEVESYDEMVYDLSNPINRHYSVKECMEFFSISFKKFDEVVFKNGYKKNDYGIKFKYIKTEIISNGLNTDLKINNSVFAIYFE